MKDALYALMEAKRLSPLSYYFARFVARGSGVALDSIVAHSAALVSARNLDGDVCADLARYAGRPLFTEAGDRSPHGPPLEQWLAALDACPWVGKPGEHAPLLLDGARLYLGKYWQFETQVAQALRARMQPVADLDPALLSRGLAQWFPPAASGSGPVDWQRVAAAVAVRNRLTVVSGGPGTGKTRTVVRLLALLLAQHPELRIALAAPTGKAAARLSAAVRGGKVELAGEAAWLDKIPETAATLHRLLGFGRRGTPRHDHDHPLLCDCLVVDEASMIDLPMMAGLLAALPDAARLVLLGDRDQLASVEAGNVLGDITGQGRKIRYTADQVAFLESVQAAPQHALRADPRATQVADSIGLLKFSYRFGADSAIGKLARRVNAGQPDPALNLLRDERTPDIHWLQASPDTLHPDCVSWAVQHYQRYLKKDDVLDALKTFAKSRVLAALHHGPFGIDEINRRIEAQLQRDGAIAGGAEYHGKPVMVTRNDYEVGLFNGDIGLLWKENNVLKAWFLLSEGELRSVPVRQLPEHNCAYALTVHKSQGSEFAEVLLVLPSTPSPAVSRELIYTGITRARDKVTIHGSPEAFAEGCCRKLQRSSGLARRLGWGEEQPQSVDTQRDSG